MAVSELVSEALDGRLPTSVTFYDSALDVPAPRPAQPLAEHRAMQLVADEDGQVHAHRLDVVDDVRA